MQSVNVEADSCLWRPDQRRIEGSNFTRWAAWLERNRGLSFDDYPSQWRWSVEKPGEFWEAIVEFFGVRFNTPARQPIGEPLMPGTEWFPGATLNYAEHVFGREDERASDAVVVALNEGGDAVSLSRFELRRRVAVVAKTLRSLGVRRGDTVVGYLPNGIECLTTFLATASVGGIWSNCALDLQARGVIDRFAQIQPAILVASTNSRYNGRVHALNSGVEEIARGLGSLQHVILVGASELPPAGDGWPAGIGRSRWEDLPWNEEADELTFESVPFEHPLWILYSSGTSGAPKAIVQSHGGILLEHLKALALHLDLRDGDRFFWYTTSGWMMWNFLVSGLLLSGVTIYLYDGSPKFPDWNCMWRVVADQRITVFGTSAPFLQACMKQEMEPGAAEAFPALRTIGTTGAPFPAEGFEWIYRAVKRDLLLASISGGTDFCTAVAICHPHLPVWPGEIQCLALGADVRALDEDGALVSGRVGELVIGTPLPSMPVRFWNDPDGRRLRASYFERYPGLWDHGDWIEVRTPAERIIISGRSDATLNRGGVRMGTSEFYVVVEALPDIAEALVIDTSHGGQDGMLCLFLKMVDGTALTDERKREICGILRDRLSPRHVPDFIEEIPEVPHSLNGKKLEIPTKRLLTGTPAEGAFPKGVTAEVESISWLEQFAARNGLSSASGR